MQELSNIRSKIAVTTCNTNDMIQFDMIKSFI